MSGERKTGGALRRVFFAVIVLAAISPVLYVLSGPPAELLVVKMGQPEWLVVVGEKFYTPLAWSLDRLPDGAVMDWWIMYGGWWEEILCPLPTP